MEVERLLLCRLVGVPCCPSTPGRHHAALCDADWSQLAWAGKRNMWFITIQQILFEIQKINSLFIWALHWMSDRLNTRDVTVRLKTSCSGTAKAFQAIFEINCHRTKTFGGRLQSKKDSPASWPAFLAFHIHTEIEMNVERFGVPERGYRFLCAVKQQFTAAAASLLVDQLENITWAVILIIYSMSTFRYEHDWQGQ